MPNDKSSEVIYALRGINPPLDAAGVLITEGAWVIRAWTMGQVAGLMFARAFPAEEPVGGKHHPTPATDIKVTVYGISTDPKSYGRGRMQRGTCGHAFRMLVIDESQVPEAIRHVLSGTRDELQAHYKAKTKVDV